MKKLHILILLLLTLSLSGCLFPPKTPTNTGDKYQTKKGFDEFPSGPPAYIGASSNELIFNINEVKLKIHCGILEKYIGEGEEYSNYSYIISVVQNDFSLREIENIEDLTNIPNLFLLKTISYNDLISSNKYVCSINDKGGIEYNYFEEYIIPSEVFINNSDSFCLSIQQLYYNNNRYYISIRNYVDIWYEKIDLETIELNFIW